MAIRTIETLPTYNGWANYPTWAVALIFDNDEPMYNAAHAMAHKMMMRYCRKHGTEMGMLIAAGAFTNWVKRQVREANPYCIQEDLRSYANNYGHRTYVWSLNRLDSKDLFEDFLPDEQTVELPA